MQIHKTLVDQSTFNFAKIDTNKVTRIVASIAIAGIAVHMLTNIPSATALEFRDVYPLSSVFIGIWSFINGFKQVYSLYDSKDDGHLLLQIQSNDCGGLSQMTPEIKGCYRQYLSNAID